MSNESLSGYLTTEEASEKYGYNRKHLQRLCKKHDALDYITVGRRTILIKETSLVKYMSQSNDDNRYGARV